MRPPEEITWEPGLNRLRTRRMKVREPNGGQAGPGGK